MSRAPISEQAVLMAAVHLLTARYGDDEDVVNPICRNPTHMQDYALQDCARLAWRLAGAVRAEAPEDAGHVVPFKATPKPRPAALAVGVV
jgi:hypothetical protein